MADAKVYVPEPGTTARTVTARRGFFCHGYRCSYYVNAGEDYARHVQFPGYYDGTGTRSWVVLKLCEHCHTEHGNPMPARRAKRGA